MSSVRNLRLSDKEVDFQRKQFYEHARVVGVRCLISSVRDEDPGTYDFYNDLVEDYGDRTHENAFATMITLQEDPPVRTLKSLGWYQEDSNDLPVIAHIPVIYEKVDHNRFTGQLSEFAPKIDDRIDIWNNTDDNLLDPDYQSYLIKDIKAQGFPNTLWYICNLTPYRKDDFHD